MTAVIRFFKVAYGSVASKPTFIFRLFTPSGSDSFITSDGKTFKVR